MSALDLPATRIQSGYSRFYQNMAAICLLVAFVGFAPTYWVPAWKGTLQVPLVAHIHGMVFFSWTLLFLAQTSLVAIGDRALHRKVGVLGIALAATMVITATLMARHSLDQGIALGLAREARAFALVPLSAAVYFAVLIAYAAKNTRRPELHKRTMVVATVSLLQPAVARWFIFLLAPAGAVGPVPVAFTVLPGLLSDLPLVYAMLHDWRKSGRVHPVYVIGTITLVAMQVLRVPVAATNAWQTFAGWFASL